MKFTKEEILNYEMKTRPSIWAQVHTRLKGAPYKFEALNPDGTIDYQKPQLLRKFLQEPMDDTHPWKSEQKARQLGLSENSARACVWFADQHNFTKQVYVFPTDGQVKDFSRTRMSEVLEDSPYLLKRMNIDPVTRKRIDKSTDDVDNVKLKKIGKSFIFFRSGATAKAGEGIDCDVVYFDEIDRMRSDIQVAFNETLSASPYGWRRDISTPSLPGVGVNASFQKSDQRHWFMKCPHCGHYFTLVLDYPHSIEEVTAQSKRSYPDIIHELDTHCYVCVKCKRPVSTQTRVMGFWHPLYPENTRIRGYQLTQMVAPWISATKMMNKLEDYKLEQLFMNYVIGLPYLGDNILLTDSDVDKCVDRSITDINALTLDNVVIGGDWGNESWQIALMPYNGKVLVLDLLKITDRDKITNDENPHIIRSVQFFRKWRATNGVYDAGYGKDRNFALLREFPGRIYSCFYPANIMDATKDFSNRWQEESNKVSVDRTMTLKIAVKKFIDNEVVIPEWVAASPLYEQFRKHLTNLVSIKDISEDAKGVETITERIGCLPGGDHFGHAWNYGIVALDKVGNKPKSDFFF